MTRLSIMREPPPLHCKACDKQIESSNPFCENCQSIIKQAEEDYEQNWQLGICTNCHNVYYAEDEYLKEINWIERPCNKCHTFKNKYILSSTLIYDFIKDFNKRYPNEAISTL